MYISSLSYFSKTNQYFVVFVTKYFGVFCLSALLTNAAARIPFVLTVPGHAPQQMERTTTLDMVS